MRDIRQDLRERLDDIAAERSKLQAQVANLQTLEDTYKAALREEELRIARISPSAQVKPLPFPASSSSGLGPIIMRVFRTKQRALALDEVRDEILTAKAFDFGEKKPGRSVHFGLVALKNGGEIEQLEDGRWRMLPNGLQTVPVQETLPQ